MSTPQPDAARPDRDRLPEQVSDIFDPTRWRVVEGFDFEDLTYHRQVERDADGRWVRDLPTVRIAFDRPEVRNAFRPGTVDELYRALDHARMTPDVGTVLLAHSQNSTGGPPPRAFVRETGAPSGALVRGTGAQPRSILGTGTALLRD